ncbi:hypothetical protein GC163_03795 [bacterium]|nr:hypothetical protein [bacterium]
MSILQIPCPACRQVLKIRDRSLLGRKAKCPKCSHAFVLEETDEVELQLAANPNPVAWAPTSTPRTSPETQAFPGISTIPTSTVTSTTSTAAGRLRDSQKRRSKGRWLSVLLGVFVLGAGGGVGYYIFTQPKIPAANPAGFAASAATHDAKPTAFDAGPLPAALASPTAGEPISMELLPAGVRTLLHLRPAELWVPQSQGEDLRYSLGPLGEFLDQQIQLQARAAPADIEELVFAWIPGTRGTAPSLAVVVHLKEEAKKSELLDRLGGELIDTFGHPVYVSNDRAACIVNLKTYAICPEFMAEEMVNAIRGQNPQPTGMEGLLEETDRQRHMTLLFEPTAVLLDSDFMATELAQPLLKQGMDWFGDDAETVAWSFHLQPDRFYSDLTVRNTTNVRAASLEELLLQRLQALPDDVLGAVKYMQPRQEGMRQLIGRFPAMTKVLSLATRSEHGPRSVRLVTSLPAKAGPNLALGSLFAWDEGTRTDYTRQLTPTSPGTSPTTNLSIADRLQKKLEVDFRRTPLYEAVGYIGSETGVTFDIDGDALKLAGYTQNMEQSYNLGEVSGLRAMQEVVKPPRDKMCFVLDEAKNLVLLTTLPAAEQKGLKVMLQFQP